MNLRESRKLHKSFREEFNEDFHIRRLKRTTDALANVKHGLVLDAGCGDGFIQRFLPETLEYIGVDFNDEYLTFLWKGGTDAICIVGDVTRLPFHDNSFDFVLNLEVIEHLPKELQKGLVSELYRVLKKVGELIISTPNRGTWFHASWWVPPHNPKHIHCVSYSELIQLLNEAGFRPKKRIGVDIVVKYPHKVFRFIPFTLRKFFASLIIGLDKYLLVKAVKE